MTSPSIPDTAQCAVFQRPGEPLVLRQVPIPQPSAGEVLVEVSCCTICGSDLHTLRGDRPAPGPVVLGHEIVGRVAELPSNGTICAMDGSRLAVGDRISWSLVASCGSCFYCRESLPQKCEQLFKYGHQALSDDRPLAGGLATHCQLVAGTSIVRVPDGLPDSVACPVNCATATIAATARAAGDCQGRSVLIQGAGMLGLTAAAMFRQQNAAAVLVADLHPQRAETARRFGATDTLVLNNRVDEQRRSLQRWVHATTTGRGVDCLVELTGAPSAIEFAPELIRIGGRLLLVGSVFPSPAVSWPPDRLVRQLLTIQGIHNYHPNDLATALQFVQDTQGIYPWSELVQAEYGLTEVHGAIERALAGDAIRVAVRPTVP